MKMKKYRIRATVSAQIEVVVEAPSKPAAYKQAAPYIHEHVPDMVLYSDRPDIEVTKDPSAYVYKSDVEIIEPDHES